MIKKTYFSPVFATSGLSSSVNELGIDDAKDKSEREYIFLRFEGLKKKF